MSTEQNIESEEAAAAVVAGGVVVVPVILPPPALLPPIGLPEESVVNAAVVVGSINEAPPPAPAPAAGGGDEMAFARHNIEKRQLIELVRLNPILWDCRLPHYKRSDKRKAIKWNELGRIFNVNGERVQRTFTSLREIFRRELNNEKLLGKHFKSKWEFYDAMAFLREVIRERKSRERCRALEASSLAEQQQHHGQNNNNTTTTNNNNNNSSHHVKKNEVSNNGIDEYQYFAPNDPNNPSNRSHHPHQHFQQLPQKPPILTAISNVSATPKIVSTSETVSVQPPPLQSQPQLATISPPLIVNGFGTQTGSVAALLPPHTLPILQIPPAVHLSNTQQLVAHHHQQQQQQQQKQQQQQPTSQISVAEASLMSHLQLQPEMAGNLNSSTSNQSGVVLATDILAPHHHHQSPPDQQQKHQQQHHTIQIGPISPNTLSTIQSRSSSPSIYIKDEPDSQDETISLASTMGIGTMATTATPMSKTMPSMQSPSPRHGRNYPNRMMTRKSTGMGPQSAQLHVRRFSTATSNATMMHATRKIHRNMSKSTQLIIDEDEMDEMDDDGDLEAELDIDDPDIELMDMDNVNVLGNSGGGRAMNAAPIDAGIRDRRLSTSSGMSLQKPHRPTAQETLYTKFGDFLAARLNTLHDSVANELMNRILLLIAEK